MLPVVLCAAHWSEKWLVAMGKAKVINYRLIEERLQTFNEGLFLTYC